MLQRKERGILLGPYCRRAANHELDQELQDRFAAQEIAEVIYHRYFSGTKMRGQRDPKFLEDINGTFVCLVCASMQHSLKAYRSGAFIEPPDFKYVHSIGTYLTLRRLITS